ncbi:Solute carrier family 43 member 3 [Lamellibrachia satsuma]|nr:Solute carrier family 43 member 3 [Lamellibrachia satsuma]
MGLTYVKETRNRVYMGLTGVPYVKETRHHVYMGLTGVPYVKETRHHVYMGLTGVTKLTPVSCRVTDTKSFARGSCISSTAGLAMSCRCTKAGVMCVLGLLECLCFSGLMFGWQAIATITARDHFFSHLCGSNSPATHASLVRHYVPVQNGTMFSILRNQKPHTTRITEGQWDNHTGLVGVTSSTSLPSTDLMTDGSTCPAQRIALWRVYAVAVSVSGLLSYPLGLAFDLCGTLKLRLVAIFLFTSATFLLTFATPGVSWLLYPGWCLLGAGGSLILLTNLQISNYFATWRNTVLLCFLGVHQASAYVIVVIKVSADAGLNIQTSFMFLTVSIVPLLVNTIAFLPRSRLPWPMPSEYSELPDSISTYIRRKRLCDVDSSEAVPRAMMSFRAILTSRLYLAQLVWFSLIMLSLNVTRIYSSSRNVGTGGDTIDFSDHVLLLGLISVIPVGLWLDRCPRSGQDSVRRKSVMRNLSAVCALLWFLTLGMSILLLGTRSDISDFVYILEAITRPVLLGTNAVILGTIYPFENFGRLYGTCLAVTEVVSSLQYSLVTGTQLRVDNAVNITCATLLLAGGAYPWLLWNQSTKHYFEMMSLPPGVQNSRPASQHRTDTFSTKLAVVRDESQV